MSVDSTGSQMRIWNRSFITLFVINLIIGVAQFSTMTLVPKLADSLGAPAVVTGLVTGMFAVTALAVRPIVGPATVRLQLNRLLAGTVVILLIAFVVYAFSTTIPLLIAARLLHGAGMGFLAPVTLAMASNTLPRSKMAQGIGIFSVGLAAATAFGPSAGLWMLSLVGYAPTFLAGAALMLLALVAAWNLPTEARPRGAVARLGWNSFIAREAVAYAMVMFFLSGAYSAVPAFLVLFGESSGVRDIGLFFAAYALFIVVSRPLAGWLADRHGPSMVIIPGVILFAIAFAVISRASSLPEFLLAGAISAFGYGICQPAIQTLCLMSVDTSRRGVASNTNYMGVDLGYLVMPVIAGWIVTSGVSSGLTTTEAYSTMYVLFTIPVAMGLALYVGHLWQRRRRQSLEAA